MHWYKPVIIGTHVEPRQSMSFKSVRRVFLGGLPMTALFFFVLFFFACKPDIKETGGTLTYFDLKGYFKADAAKLTAHNKPVLKTVVHNTITESKKISIDNWDRELSLFSNSDINKPAWKDSYAMQNTANALIYTAKDSTLETKRIIINKDGDKVKWVIIF